MGKSFRFKEKNNDLNVVNPKNSPFLTSKMPVKSLDVKIQIEKPELINKDKEPFFFSKKARPSRGIMREAYPSIVKGKVHRDKPQQES